MPIAELWAYGFEHRDDEAMGVYLELREDLVQRVGPVLRSPLLHVDPTERRMHELLEYSPLIRARIHRLGQENEILNPTFRAQYESYMRVLGFQDRIGPEDRLVLTYYLLIQNRIAEALDQFDEGRSRKRCHSAAVRLSGCLLGVVPWSVRSRRADRASLRESTHSALADAFPGIAVTTAAATRIEPNREVGFGRRADIASRALPKGVVTWP